MTTTNRYRKSTWRPYTSTEGDRDGSVEDRNALQEGVKVFRAQLQAAIHIRAVMESDQRPLGFASREDWETFSTRDRLRFRGDPELPKAVLNVWEMVTKSFRDDAELIFIALSWNSCFVGQFRQHGHYHCFVISENEEGTWSMRHNTTVTIDGYSEAIRECSLVYAPETKTPDHEETPTGSTWEECQNVKRWYEETVAGLPGHQYIARCQGFIDIWLQTYGSREAKERFQSHLISNQEEDYRDTADTLKAKDDFRDVEWEIGQRYGANPGSEQHRQLLQAIAECAVGCLIEINKDIAESSQEPMIKGYFRTMQEFWDKFYDLAFKGKNNFQEQPDVRGTGRTGGN